MPRHSTGPIPRPGSASAILAGLECPRPGCECHRAVRLGKGNTHCPVPGHGGEPVDQGGIAFLREGGESDAENRATGAIQDGGNPFEGPRSRAFPLPPLRPSPASPRFATGSSAACSTRSRARP